VGGTWRIGDGELTLKQEFQMLSGTLSTGGQSVPVKGRLLGDQITFNAGGAEYTGRVSGGAMTGAFSAGGKTAQWKAARTGA
jgi:hypothetical protein